MKSSLMVASIYHLKLISAKNQRELDKEKRIFNYRNSVFSVVFLIKSAQKMTHLQLILTLPFTLQAIKKME